MPMRVFIEQGIELTRTAGFTDMARKRYRGYVLEKLGVSLAAIQACDRWWEDLDKDCVCFRFQTDERGSTMPEWPEWWAPCNVRYGWDGGGIQECRADMLNAYFPMEPSNPDKVVAEPRRRLVSLEG